VRIQDEVESSEGMHMYPHIHALAIFLSIVRKEEVEKLSCLLESKRKQFKSGEQG
jgi:hypothetical protein